MGILLGFSPFFAFALMTRFAAPGICLWIAAAVSGLLILREKKRGHSLKVLEAGTFVLFALLGIYTALTQIHWDISGARSVVDVGLLLIVLLSLALRRPFTLQYAREMVPAAVHQSPVFIRTNYIITAVWAIAMVAVVAADLGLHYLPQFPVWLGSAVIVAALAGAFGFTIWYPKHLPTGDRS